MKDEYIYLFKNTAPEGKTLHEKAPIYRLVKRESADEWKEIAACWKTKSGKGLSCKLKEGVSITIQDPAEVDKDFNAVSTGADEINADDIPFD